MNNEKIAQELVAVARDLTAERGRVADWDITHDIMEMEDTIEDELRTSGNGIREIEQSLSMLDGTDRNWVRELEGLQEYVKALKAFQKSLKDAKRNFDRIGW